MKYFIKDDKYNFVDENNGIVGMSCWQSCCEVFGWTLRRNGACMADDSENDSLINVLLEPLRFNLEIQPYVYEVHDGLMGDVRVTLTVDLISLEDAQSHYELVLRNSHNGYYGHTASWKFGNWKGEEVL